MIVSVARFNLVIFPLSVIQQSTQQYYTNIFGRVYISAPNRQTVTCSDSSLNQLQNLNGLSKLTSVKYFYDTVHCFITRLCKRCYNFQLYYTGAVYS